MTEPLVVALPQDPGLREALGDPRNVRFIDWDLTGPAPEPQIDLVVASNFGNFEGLARLAEVNPRLVQWQWIGYDEVPAYLPQGIPLANAAGVHDGPTAELAVALTVSAQRGIPQFVRAADQHEWQSTFLPSLCDKRILIVGYGGVGKAIDARLQGFEARITRMARSARTERNLAGDEVEVHSFADLHAHLAVSDVVILAVPLTAQTRHLIDAAALAALPDNALLVNVARGGVVDTDALVAELSGARIRAALDVTDPEPLPADHPLWSAPNVMITPHAGADTDALLPRMAALIRRQITRLQSGEAPVNLVLGPGA